MTDDPLDQVALAVWLCCRAVRRKSTRKDLVLAADGLRQHAEHRNPRVRRIALGARADAFVAIAGGAAAVPSADGGAR